MNLFFSFLSIQILFLQFIMSQNIFQPPNENTSASNQSAQGQSQKLQNSISKSKQQWKRVHHPLLLFLLVNICEFYSFFEIYIFFKTTMDPNLPWPGVWGPVIGTSSFRILVFIANGIYLGGIKPMFRAYLMLDILYVLGLCTSAIFVAFQIVITVPMKQVTDPMPIATYVLIPLTQIFYIGNFRLMLMICKWGKWKVIFYKLKLYGGCFFFIFYGLLYEYTKRQGVYECSACEPLNPQCQHSCTTVNETVTYCCMDVDNLWKSGIDKINQFFVLFLATALAYCSQMIAIMSDFDGVSHFDVHYTLGMDEDQQQSELSHQENKMMATQQLINLPQDNELKNNNNKVFPLKPLKIRNSKYQRNASNITLEQFRETEALDKTAENRELYEKE